MKLHELKPNSRKTRNRRGRGDASGKGNFSGRGCKGQNSRTGKNVRKGFEGGQTPLLQRMPKARGFRNPTRIEAKILDLAALEAKFKDKEKVTLESLLEKRLIESKNGKVKILGEGELTKALEVSGVLVSASARAAIKKAGGNVADDSKE